MYYISMMFGRDMNITKKLISVADIKSVNTNTLKEKS